MRRTARRWWWCRRARSSWARRSTEVDRSKGEDPLHRVTFARPFAVGRFTVSFDEWDACLADGGCDGNKGDDREFGRGRMPAQGISFEAAKSYLAWLSRKVGRTYRLPSESEREYFARAGTTTPFWFGKTISAQNANYAAVEHPTPAGRTASTARARRWSIPTRRTRSGSIRCTAMSEEWTEDCFNKRYTEDTPTDGAPWLEGDCTKRMLRGGILELDRRTTSRAGYRDDAFHGGGNSFRVVRTLNVRAVNASDTAPASAALLVAERMSIRGFASFDRGVIRTCLLQANPPSRPVIAKNCATVSSMIWLRRSSPRRSGRPIARPAPAPLPCRRRNRASRMPFSASGAIRPSS